MSTRQHRVVRVSPQKLVHAPSRPIKCPICRKQLSSAAAFRIHRILTHHVIENEEDLKFCARSRAATSECSVKPTSTTQSKLELNEYFCPIHDCRYHDDVSLASLARLKQHYYKVHAPKTLSCSKCKRAKFSLPMYLRAHEKYCSYLERNCIRIGKSATSEQNHERNGQRRELDVSEDSSTTTTNVPTPKVIVLFAVPKTLTSTVQSATSVPETASNAVPSKAEIGLNSARTDHNSKSKLLSTGSSDTGGMKPRFRPILSKSTNTDLTTNPNQRLKLRPLRCKPTKLVPSTLRLRCATRNMAVQCEMSEPCLSQEVQTTTQPVFSLQTQTMPPTPTVPTTAELPVGEFLSHQNFYAAAMATNFVPSYYQQSMPQMVDAAVNAMDEFQRQQDASMNAPPDLYTEQRHMSTNTAANWFGSATDIEYDLVTQQTQTTQDDLDDILRTIETQTFQEGPEDPSLTDALTQTSLIDFIESGFTSSQTQTPGPADTGYGQL